MFKLEVPTNYELVINGKTYKYNKETGKIISISETKIEGTEELETKEVSINNGVAIKQAKLTRWQENIVEIDLGDIRLTFYDIVRKPSKEALFKRDVLPNSKV